MSQTNPTPLAGNVAEYIVVVSNEEDLHSGFHDFAEKVNRKLRAGYQLHGAPVGTNKLLCQALVRLEAVAPVADASTFYQPPQSPGLR